MIRAPFGSWPSPISAEQLAVGGRRLEGPVWVGQKLYWTESRAAEGGRQVIVRTEDDVVLERDGAEPLRTVDLLPDPFNARSRVHEYGGSSWAAIPGDGDAEPLLVFVNFADQRIYRFREGEPPVPISPAGPEVASAGGPSLRWAQPLVVHSPVRHLAQNPAQNPVQYPGGDAVGWGAAGTVTELPGDGTEVWWVCEEHLGRADHDGAPLIERYIAAVPLDGRAAEDGAAVRRVTPSSRFVANAALSPDHRHIAWVCWEHPDMPWDSTGLHVGELVDGVVGAHRVLDGGPEVSVLEPHWRDAETLTYLSDRSGWWNPWSASLDGESHPLLHDDQEYAGPLWQLGMSWLADLPAAAIAADDPGSHRMLSIHGRATQRLGVLDTSSGTMEPVQLPHTRISEVAVRDDGVLAVLGGSPEEFSNLSVVRLRREYGHWVPEASRLARSSRDDPPAPQLLPRPEPITVDVPSSGPVHAVVYRPYQEGYAGEDAELPPFIAHVHGGPTGQAVVGLALDIAYYTSRGIGVVDINYGGSSGFGREYRNRLRGQWGVVDVADTVAVMEHLVAEGIADGQRLGIEGGSAGGWTTLACLTRTDTFSAGVSSFGVADAVALALDTHDFESRYLDRLIGPYPEAADVYRERAPLNHVDELSCPVLLLQGDEDAIVPPSQAEMFRDALVAKGIPHAYLLFEGEQHGFRKAESIISATEAALSFYGQVFGFTPAGVPRLDLRRE